MSVDTPNVHIVLLALHSVFPPKQAWHRTMGETIVTRHEKRRRRSALFSVATCRLTTLCLVGCMFHPGTTTEAFAPPVFVSTTTSPNLLCWRTSTRLYESSLTGNDETNNHANQNKKSNSNNNDAPAPEEVKRKRRIRSLVRSIAKRVVPRPFSSSSEAYAQPDAIAEVLKEAVLLAVDEALAHRDLVRHKTNNNDPRLSKNALLDRVNTNNNNNNNNNSSSNNNNTNNNTSFIDRDLEALITQAFGPVEQTLDDLERSLQQARASLTAAKAQASDAVQAVQAAARVQVEGAATATRVATAVASRRAVAEMYAAVNHVDVESLTYDDVDFAASQMTPPFLDDNQCLVPGEPVVRVEKAPENSRRIFAGIDIMASVDTVWNVLTDYGNLQNVVPNLEVNEIVRTFPGRDVSEWEIDDSKTELEQCQELASQLKGSVLRQVGKVSLRDCILAGSTSYAHSLVVPS